MNPREPNTEDGIFHFENLKLLVPPSYIRQLEEQAPDGEQTGEASESSRDNQFLHEEE